MKRDTLRLAKRHYPTIRQNGQALVEVIVGFVVIGLFLTGAHHLWRYGEAQQMAVDAVRFAAWERVVWEPDNNSVEKHALHKSDASLGLATVRHQLSTPQAMRTYRSSVQHDGSPTFFSNDQRRSWLKSALKTFVAPGRDPDSIISLSTSSGWTNDVEHWYRGRDPTFNTTTSLELDRDTYRTVILSFKSQLAPLVPDGRRWFEFLLPPVDAVEKLSLISNTWAASGPLQRIRTARQLLPLSPGDATSGTKGNVLAFFGLNNDPGQIDAANFVGMVPWWNFVAGQNGMAGQYVVDQVGLNAVAANGMLQSSGQNFRKDFSAADPAASFLLRAQMARSEAFNPSDISQGRHRHTEIVDETADAATPVPRNSENKRRKYRSVSLQNPVETYFAEY